MSWKNVLVLGSIILLSAALAPPLAAHPVDAADTPIDDTGGDETVPGVNVIRNVSSSEVIIQLTKGNRHAHFNIIARGVDVVDIDDDFPGVDGLDGSGTDGDWWTDGEWGGCRDELETKFGTGNIAKAKFYTCSAPDTIRLHLGEPRIGRGSFPAIKIVFTEGVLKDVDGVFVGTDDTTDWGNGWIPLYE